MAASEAQYSCYQLFFEAGHEGMLMVSEEGILLDANPEACNILGYGREELLSEGLRGVVDPSDPRWKAVLEKRHLGDKRRLGLRLLRRDGTPFVAEVSLAECADGNGGNLLGVVFRERDEVGEFPNEGARLGQALVENGCNLITLCDADNTIRYVSPSVERVLGYELEELAGASTLSLIHPDDLALAAWEAETAVNDPDRSSPPVRYRRKDGSWIYLESVTSNLLDDPSVRGIVIDSRDVTDRVLAEQENRRLDEDLKGRIAQQDARLKAAMSEADDYQRMLRESVERFRALVQNSSSVITILEPDGTIRYESPSIERVLGHRPEELVGKNAFDYVHPEDKERVLGVFTRGLKNDVATASGEFRFRHADGSWRYVEGIGNNLLDDPSVGGVVINFHDVTERKLAEDALRQSEGRYRAVVEQAAENIFLVDVETRRILEANAALHTSLGYTAEELRRMTLYDVVAHDRESIDRNIRRILTEKRSFIDERKYRRKDGSLIDVEVNADAIPYGDKKALCIVAHDVTERKRTEESLRRSLGVFLALREAGQILGSTLESEEIVTRLLKIMHGVSGLTTAVISVQDERGQLRIWRAVGLEGLWRRARYASEAEATRRKVLEEGKNRLFRLRRPDSETGHLAGLCLPLRMRDDRIAGVLEAYGPESLADNEAVELLRSLAAQAASALENARLYGELAEREKRLADLVGQLFAAQEEERRHVAYEVHDGLAQVAASAHQHLQGFARLYPPDSDEGRELLARTLKLVQWTVGEARRVIADLRPTALDDFGLQTAIRLEVDELRADGWNVGYEADLGDDERLPVAAETALFRIAQEALRNIRRHADTDRVCLRLGRAGKKVRLTVRDWGKGFDPAASPSGNGPGERIGLSSMRERVALLGGNFRIHSRPGVGTLIVVDVPLPEGYREGSGF